LAGRKTNGKAALEPAFPLGKSTRSGLLDHLLNVVVMVVMMMVVTVMMLAVMMMMVVVMLLGRSRISAGGANHRDAERQGQSQPGRGEEGLLHDFVSFFRGRSETHRTKSVTQAPRWNYPPGFFRQFFPTVDFCF